MTGCATCSDGTTCDTCYSDAYEEVAGDSTCKVKCPPGKLRDVSASPYECTLGCIAHCDECTDATTCTDCAIGFSGTLCDACATGFKDSDEDATEAECDACVTGYGPYPDCDVCADGYEPVASACVAECGTGKYRDIGGVCQNCVANCDVCINSTKCTECSATFTLNATTKLCEAGAGAP